MVQKATELPGAIYLGSVLSGPTAHCSGLLEWVHGHPEKAYQHWRKAAETAALIPLSYEAGRAELLLAEHLPSDHPEKEGHLQKPIAAFTSSGYDNWALLASNQPRLAP